MVMKMTKFRLGFSLFETFVVMAIVGIFIALMANTVAHRPKAKLASEAHGRFECYYDESGQLWQQLFTEGSSQGKKLAKNNGGTETTCSFQPPYYAKYMIIDAVGGGAGGDSSSGGSEGQFVSAFYDYVATSYKITPGIGGSAKVGTTAPKNGTDTIVYDQDGNKLVTALGGKTTASLINTTIDDVKSCAITDWSTVDEFWCNIPPSCQVMNGKIQVSYCRSKGAYVTRDIGYKTTKTDGTVEMGNPRYIVNDVYTQRKAGTSDTWVYHDISVFSDYDSESLDPTKNTGFDPKNESKNYMLDDPYSPSLYIMELVMETNVKGTSSTKSNLAMFVESMQYTSDIKNANVGMGGGANQAGKAGAVLFLW